MQKRKRMTRLARRRVLLRAALEVSESGHYSSISRSEVAAKAGVSEGLVTYYFDSMDYLRECVIREAIRTQNLTVLAQGLALRDTVALQAPASLRKQAIRTLG